MNDRDAAVAIRDSAVAVLDDERLKGLIPEGKGAQAPEAD